MKFRSKFKSPTEKGSSHKEFEPDKELNDVCFKNTPIHSHRTVRRYITYATEKRRYKNPRINRPTTMQ
jgi:hypothetical protein